MQPFLRAFAAVGAAALLAAVVQAQDAQAQKKTGPPAYKSVWKIDLPAGTSRIAVADVTEDKKPRLLVLGADNALSIQDLSGAAPKEETKVELGAKGPSFVAGRFAKGKPALIVVPGAIFYREGEKYAKREAADLNDITGWARFVDGTTNVFFFEGNGAPTTWAVDLSAKNPLTGGSEMVSPEQGGGVYAEVIGRLSSEIVRGFGVPEEAAATGIIGLADPRGESKIYAMLPWQGADGSFITFVDVASLGHAGGGGDFKPLWKSPKLGGKVLDVTFGADPKGSKQTGLFVLMSVGDDDKRRVVEFFALD